ncbi:MAG TPA: hypothetical protein VJH65_02090 [Candidatus Nanoarchaeia archaeon]|nr:hypothetical protein [Candidatus Nanoarchaeia archaeon]
MAIAKKKRKFLDVEIPLINKVTQLYAYDLKETEGRTIKYDLTRIIRGKNVILKTTVKVEGDKAIGIPKEIVVLPTYLKRMVRKGTSYVEDSFLTNCKDAEIKIKPLLVTRRHVPREIKKALRKKAKEELIEYAKNKTAENIFQDVLKNNLQRDLGLKLKKIYPLSLCEIRLLEVKKSLA